MTWQIIITEAKSISLCFVLCSYSVILDREAMWIIRVSCAIQGSCRTVQSKCELIATSIRFSWASVHLQMTRYQASIEEKLNKSLTYICHS